MLKAGRISNVIDHTTAVSTAIKGRTQRLKALLTGRVPYLQHTNLAIFHFDLSISEVGSDGWLEVRAELALLKKVNERRLADAGVSNDHKFDEALALLVFFAVRRVPWAQVFHLL